MMNEILGPAGHPISGAKAKELFGGDLADFYRNILMKCCVPIYWYRRDIDQPEILHNGTVTLVKTPKLLLGITAAHVLREFEKDSGRNSITLQLANETIDDLINNVIDISDKYDLATIAISEELLPRLGKATTPLGFWPPKPPQEGRGIMIAGYPGVERVQPKELEVNFGLFTALVIARTVTDIQITWLVEPEHQLENAKIKPPPQNYNLGGVSGGPLISWFESENFVAHFCLSGIVTEHPDYENSDFYIERLVAARADLIRDDGSIHR
jgi:hypothetical protein